MTLFARSKVNAADDTGAVGGIAAADLPQTRARAIGGVLREARLGYGRQLNEIGSVLRIRPPYLQAIEEGRYEELPGSTYAIGFIRTYAEYLGLDGAGMGRRFKQASEGLELKHNLSFPMPLTERSVPGGTILLLAFILAICGYGMWYYFSSNERTRPERVSAVPARLLAPSSPAVGAAPGAAPAESAHPNDAAAAAPSWPDPLPASVPSPSPAPPAPAAAPPPISAAPLAAEPAPAAPVPAPPGIALAPRAAAPASPAPTPSVASLPGPADAGIPQGDPAQTFGVTHGPARIVIRAISDTWIQVREGEKTQLFARLMRPGDIYRVPEKPGLAMSIGNAAGLEITVDGRLIPPLGGVGVVRKSVMLDPSRLLGGRATTE